MSTSRTGVKIYVDDEELAAIDAAVALTDWPRAEWVRAVLLPAAAWCVAHEATPEALALMLRHQAAHPTAAAALRELGDLGGPGWERALDELLACREAYLRAQLDAASARRKAPAARRR